MPAVELVPTAQLATNHNKFQAGWFFHLLETAEMNFRIENVCF